MPPLRSAWDEWTSMPDRYWWGWLLSVPVACAVGLTMSLGWLSQMLPLDEESGDAIIGDVIAAGAILVVAARFAFILMVIALRSYTRFRRRHIALNGKVEIMPLAALISDPAKAPDVSSEPLVLSWRATTSMRTVGALLYMLLIVCYGAILVLSVAAIVVEFAAQPDPIHHLTRAGWVILILSGGGEIGALILIVVFLLYSPTLFGRPYGITASSTGIEGRPQLGHRFALRWDDILLFEVKKDGKSRFSAHSYYVYGQQDIVSWQDNPANYNEFAPNGVTSGEMALRLEAMVNLVVARTGLQPRTFAPSLLQPRTSAPSLKAAASDVPRSEARLRRSNFVSYISLGFFTTGVAVAVLALKPTTVFSLNAGIAVSLILLALLFAAAGTRLLLRGPSRAKTNGQLPGAPDAVPPAMTPNTVFQLQVAIGPLVRAILAILGLFLCLNLAPAIMVLPRFFLQGELPSGLPSVGGVLQAMLSFLLLLYGFVGLGFLAAAAGNRKRIIRADELGLSASSGMVPQALAWDDIELVVAYAGRGTIASYAAKGKGGSVIISWPAHSTSASRVETHNGSPSISPDEFAALVSVRSGKPIEVRDAQ